MTISTAEVLESSTSLSEFTAAPATPGAMTLASETLASATTVSAAPARPTVQAIPAQRVGTERAVSTKRRRRVRVDWYALAVILLMLASAALGVYRLAWAMQP